MPPFQSGPDGWNEILGKMRLGDITERTGFPRRIEQLTLVMSRHVDDGHLEAAVAEQHCRFEPVHDRHIDIDDDHIGVEGSRGGDELGPVGHGAHNTKFTGQKVDDSVQEGLKIVGNEHTRAFAL